MRNQLIMKVDMNDERIPMFLVEDWKEWVQINRPQYDFEVYLFEEDKECTLLAEYYVGTGWWEEYV